MTVVWASRHENLVSDGFVSPHVCDPRVIPDRNIVLARCHPSGSAVDADLDTAARALRATSVADGGVVYVPQTIDASPHAPPIHA